MAMFDSIQSRTNGRWTKEQHQKFLYGLKIYGKNWKKIQDLIQTRTSTQIRSHAQKFFIKIKKTENFDDSENMQIQSQSKFAQETIVSPSEAKQVERQKPAFSFYFERIVNNLAIFKEQGKEFDFWDCLVDYKNVQKHQSCEELQFLRQFKIDLQRNSSYTDDVRSQGGLNAKILGRQYSCFQQFQSGPCKQIKI